MYRASGRPLVRLLNASHSSNISHKSNSLSYLKPCSHLTLKTQKKDEEERNVENIFPQTWNSNSRDTQRHLLNTISPQFILPHNVMSSARFHTLVRSTQLSKESFLEFSSGNKR